MKKTEANSKKRKTIETSKELLTIGTYGSRKDFIVKSKKKKSPEQTKKSLQTFKMQRSPLLNKSQEFIPKFKKSTLDIMDMPEDERDELDILDTEGCSNVIEMTVNLFEESDSDDTDSEDEVTATICPNTLRLQYPSDYKYDSKTKKKKLISEVNEKIEKLYVSEEEL